MGNCTSDNRPQNLEESQYNEDFQEVPMKQKQAYNMKSENNAILSTPILESVGSRIGDKSNQNQDVNGAHESIQEFIAENESSQEQIPENILNDSLKGLPKEEDDPIAFHSPSSKIAIITKEKFEITKKMKDLLNDLGKFVLPQPDQAFAKLPEIGVVEYENQIKYFGQYFRGKRQGLGKQTWGDGSFYKGYFFDDQLHGFGRMVYYNGDYYLGEWKMNQSDGQGKYVDIQGNIYQGEWKANKQHGIGQETKNNGQVYEGSYQEGLRQGLGKLNTEDFTYQGEFQGNKMDGKGEIQWQDGRSYKGEFKENLLHGFGVFKWGQGTYTGYYVKSLQEGHGQMEYGDGKIYDGEWKNGYQEGKGYFYDVDGDEKKGFWQKGRLVQD